MFIRKFYVFPKVNCLQHFKLHFEHFTYNADKKIIIQKQKLLYYHISFLPYIAWTLRTISMNRITFEQYIYQPFQLLFSIDTLYISCILPCKSSEIISENALNLYQNISLRNHLNVVSMFRLQWGLVTFMYIV